MLFLWLCVFLHVSSLVEEVPQFVIPHLGKSMHPLSTEFIWIMPCRILVLEFVPSWHWWSTLLLNSCWPAGSGLLLLFICFFQLSFKTEDFLKVEISGGSSNYHNSCTIFLLCWTCRFQLIGKICHVSCDRFFFFFFPFSDVELNCP